MKKLLIILLLVPLLTAASSTVVDDATLMDIRVACDKKSVVFEVLMQGPAQEVPIWKGAEYDTNVVLFANRETGSWTMVQYDKNIACVLAAGDDSRPIPQRSMQTIRLTI
jgi:hypothetical protein